MNTLVFDIETIPDVAAARQINDFSSLSDEDVVNAMLQKNRQTKGHDFLPLHLHQVVAISVVLATRDQLKVWSIGDETAGEAEIIQRFFDGLQQFSPVLVSWNGSGFDLPVLHYRALKHRIQAAHYWETGERDSQFKWNNYINRYHYRHTDVMDILAGYQMKANAPLTEIATMLGYPGKMGMDGSKVWPAYQSGNIKAIRDYCETDVLNTYLVYLCFQHMQGILSDSALELAEQQVASLLEDSQEPHLQAFVEAWQTH